MSDNFYIIDEYSKHDVLMTEYTAEDYIGWYRVIYDSNGIIIAVLEITRAYLDEIGDLGEKGQEWTITKSFTTNKINIDDEDFDPRFGVTTDKYSIDLTTKKVIPKTEYENYVGWYKVIRDESGSVIDVIEITEDMLLSIYFDEPSWEVTSDYKINNRTSQGFKFYAKENNHVEGGSSLENGLSKPLSNRVESVEDIDDIDHKKEVTEKLKSQKLKYNPSVATKSYPETCVTSTGKESSNPYYGNAGGCVKKFRVDINSL